jgi:hypothetical protein
MSKYVWENLDTHVFGEVRDPEMVELDLYWTLVRIELDVDGDFCE